MNRVNILLPAKTMEKFASPDFNLVGNPNSDFLGQKNEWNYFKFTAQYLDLARVYYHCRDARSTGPLAQAVGSLFPVFIGL
jgi:hypothetical protein